MLIELQVYTIRSLKNLYNVKEKSIHVTNSMVTDNYIPDLPIFVFSVSRSTILLIAFRLSLMRQTARLCHALLHQADLVLALGCQES